MKITTFNELGQLYREAADIFVSQAELAIEKDNKFTIALSGGSSPKAIFELLASEEYISKIQWNKVYVFWVDERWVPIEDNRSNAKMTFETLLSKIDIPASNIFTMYKDGIEPEVFAAEYENSIREIVGEKGKFDFVLLGMGEDGHTASLFPNEPILDETKKWVDAYYLAPQEMFRITLTAPIINQSAYILLITFGAGKSKALHEVLHGAYNPKTYPLQLIQPVHGDIHLLTDNEALNQDSK